VTLDLAWLDQQMEKSPTPNGGIVVVLDRNGRVLARNPEGAKWLGKPVFDEKTFARVTAQPEFQGELTALADVPRIWALERIPNGGGLYAGVGLSPDAVYGPSRRLLLQNATGLALVFAVAISIALLGTRRVALGPLLRLRRAASQISSGPVRNARTGCASLTFRSIVEGMASVTGPEYFPSLVRHLATALGARRVLVGELVGEDKVRALAFWNDGEYGENLTYDLAEMPRDPAVRQDLLGRDGKVLGVLAALNSEPLEDAESAGAILHVFASRAAAELERVRADTVLRAAEDRNRRLARELQIASQQLLEGEKLARFGTFVSIADGDFLASPELSRTLGVMPSSSESEGSIFRVVDRSHVRAHVRAAVVPEDHEKMREAARLKLEEQSRRIEAYFESFRIRRAGHPDGGRRRPGDASESRAGADVRLQARRDRGAEPGPADSQMGICVRLGGVGAPQGWNGVPGKTGFQLHRDRNGNGDAGFSDRRDRAEGARGRAPEDAGGASRTDRAHRARQRAGTHPDRP
jgi:hypothetical protein